MSTHFSQETELTSPEYPYKTNPPHSSRIQRLFLILGAFFITNALMAEFIGVKIFSLEKTIGITPFDFNILGIEHLSFNLTAGVILWPFVFISTDIINEYFGKKGVRLLSILTVIMIAYAFVMVLISIRLHPADFWLFQDDPNVIGGKINRSTSFNNVFGQGLWIIIASMVAFLIGQLVDVSSFHWIRKFTGSKNIWLRATGSTLISQFIDSFVVLFIAFYIGAGYKLEWVLAVGLVNYAYKVIAALMLSPLIILVHTWIDNYLGKEVAHKLIEDASKQ